MMSSGGGERGKERSRRDKGDMPEGGADECEMGRRGQAKRDLEPGAPEVGYRGAGSRL